MIAVVCQAFRMVDPEVVNVRYIKGIIALPAIGIDDAVGYDLALNNRRQAVR